MSFATNEFVFSIYIYTYTHIYIYVLGENVILQG